MKTAERTTTFVANLFDEAERDPAPSGAEGLGLLTTGPFQMTNGLRLWFRPIAPGDAARLQEFHRRLSPESQRMRFFSPLRELSRGMARRLTNLDFEDRVALVGCYPGEDAIRAVARYEVGRDGRSAELAFVVEDELQGMGVGKVMLHLLARHARYMGIDQFVATVLPENRHMLSMFESCDYPSHRVWTAEAVNVTMDISRNSCHRHELAAG